MLNNLLHFLKALGLAFICFLLYFILFITLTGCGSNKPGPAKIEEVEVIYERFVQEAKTRNIDLSLLKKPTFILEDLPDFNPEDEYYTLGYCSTASNTVVLNSKYYSSLSDQMKEILVFHELGHCVLGRVHDNQCTIRFNDQCIAPGSLMYPFLNIIDKNYQSNRSLYLDELFLYTPTL